MTNSPFIYLVHIHPLFFLFFSFFFLQLPLQHMEVPSLGGEWELQLWPTLQPWQHRIWASSATHAEVCSNPRSLPTEQGQGSNPHPHRDSVGSSTSWATTRTFVLLLCSNLADFFFLMHSMKFCAEMLLSHIKARMTMSRTLLNFVYELFSVSF